ncbi:MAG TPA: SGNH/GDSL hydrolase family protein, partial [Verrucomicrobiae bacterium]|nr:SGNH/GDSL hydrolase family protein [Verrucomicrobiae bacterium]
MILKKGDRLAICGDSITEQKMYSRIIEDYLTMCAPQLDISVRQYGWSGEKAWQFLRRMTNDCLRFDPTIATTCYGMNDFEYRPFEDRIGRIYYTNSLEVVDAFKSHHVRVILGSPGCISKVPWWQKAPDYTVENLNLSLCEFRNIDIGIARDEGVRFADVFWPMLTADYSGRQRYGPDYAIPGRDGVHPYWAGHLIMAYAFLTAMGLPGDIGTVRIDLKRNRIKASKGQKVVSAGAGAWTIESSRYPFCPCEPSGLATASYPVCGEDTIKTNDSIRSGMTLVPFNEHLNRFLLIVKNAASPVYQVSWGDVSKTFTSSQLAAGVNLAAEFPENPFSAAFAKVDAAIANKQAFETTEIKSIFHGNPNSSMSAIVARTDKAVGKAEEEHSALVAAIHAAFVPVTYTL